ncbi:MAG: hypothetical protein Q8S84_06945 [bacterium]|nr:hypothetical protein [bacterium]MDP3381195.1 hypothetical protein [bacterium]
MNGLFFSHTIDICNSFFTKLLLFSSVVSFIFFVFFTFAILFLFLTVSSLISFIFSIVSMKVSYFFAIPEYTTHREYLLHDLASVILCFPIILALSHSLFNDLLSIITRFFKSISLLFLSLKS